ncbi:MAG: serine/threonine protein kinase [Planctomycetes bacterium]|nr:serine/threonine protein kinase [Planctomycetota bacterium]
MDREDFRRLQQLYEAARRVPDEERRTFVERVCSGETTMREALFALLNEEGGERSEGVPASEVGESAVVEPATTVQGERAPREDARAAMSVEEYAEGPGDVFGPYTLIDVLGEGGFGTVYRAKQREPVEREVAFKILKLGMDSKQVVARFEAERQLLARMDHPNIAKVHDAGMTAKGRPYFVMELVRGQPITEYCDTKKLTAEERVRLLTKVCQAVQHAHQKGVIHRDLKPSNVLVEEIDGEAVPRVIDFGIAKAVGPADENRTMLTKEAMFMGTPDYMAPEQALGELDIDTRADVYSLGVLLYELLTGTRPFDFEKLLERGYGNWLEHVREVPAPKPSTRLADLGVRRVTIADVRGATPYHLDRFLRGDLDWIAMRALEKDRSRRYASANELAEDLQRFTRNEVVLAGPPSALYRLRKFARRHRVVMAMTAVVLLASVGSLGALVWSFLNVRVERDRANAAATEAREQRDRANHEFERAQLEEGRAREAAEVARRERDHAHRAARTAERVSAFLADLFHASDPGEARGEARRARDLLDVGVAQLSALDDDPSVQNHLRNDLGIIYLRLGEFDEARPLVEASRAYFEANEAEDPKARARSLRNAALLLDNGDADPVAAEPLARRAVEIAATTDDEPLRAETWNTFATTLWHQGLLAEAEDAFQRSIALYESLYGEHDPRITAPLVNLGSVHLMSSDYEAAEAVYARAIAIEEAQADCETDFEFATTLHLMALVCEGREEFERALAYERRSLAIREAVLGPEHWHVALSLTTLGDLLRKTGHAKDGLPLLRRAVAIAEKTWDAHPDLWWSQRSLAETLLASSQFAEARTVAERQIEALRGYEGVDEWVALCLAIRGAALRGEGRATEAEPVLRDALERMTNTYGSSDPARLRTLHLLATLLRELGRESEAKKLLDERRSGR